MNLTLGIYWYIDNNRLGEWLGYDNILKLDMITADIEVYGLEIFKQTIHRADSISESLLNKLLNDFRDIDKENKEALKKVYLNFIVENCKRDKKILQKRKIEDDADGDENYSEADEYKVAKDIQEREEAELSSQAEYIENTVQLEELSNKNLSDIEQYALNFIRHRNDKHPLLNHFTFGGIVQIANRAAYKLLYLRQKR